MSHSAVLPPSVLSVFDFAPWRLSGVVVGTLLNDPAQLAALGDAVNEAPYRAPPQAPVLYVKPRNTLAADGARSLLPPGVQQLQVGATIGLVIGRAACRVHADDAAAFIAGCTLVVDLFAPHESLYRPAMRERAFDGSCIVGPRVVAHEALDPDAAVLHVRVGDAAALSVPMSGLLRPAAKLLEAVTAFMTLHPGDLLMLGVREGAPLAAAGQRWRVDCDAIGTLQGEVFAASARATA